jgi:iron complex outermembrane receptor protein
MRVSLRAFVSAGALAAALASAPQAWAQDEDAATVETIVVTARKTSENLQETPLSITALTSATLEAKGIKNAADLQFTVPNLTLFTNNDFNPNFIIRGISTGARNVGFESGLGVYVDGVYMGRTSSFTQGMTDVARVEVLRGPQGTLFGKNTIAGAINIVSETATNDVQGSAFLEVGNYNSVRTEGGIRGPIVPDHLFGKISWFTSKRDGYLKNANTSGTGPKTIDDEDVKGIRGELRWAVTDNFELTLRGDYAHNDQTGEDSEILSGLGATPGDHTVDVNRPNTEKRTIQGVSLTGTYKLPGGFDLISITAQRNLEYAIPDMDLDDTPLDLLGNDYVDKLSQFSQELRLQSPRGERLTYVAGLYYFKQTGKSERSVFLGADSGAEGFTLTDHSQVETKAFAAFINGEFRFTDQLSISGGLRYTREKKTLRFAQDPIPFLPYNDVDDGRGSLEEDDLSPTVTLDYKFTPDVFGYARVSRGFKSGGWNADYYVSADPVFNADNIAFDSESIVVYEVGLKTVLFDGRLRFNVAVFDQEYKDIQISQFVDGLSGFRTTNAGAARSRGFEVDFNLVPVRGLTIDGGLGYADAEYTDYRNATDAGDDFTGLPLQGPKWTANLGVQYRHPVSDIGHVVVRGDYAYRSSSPTEPTDPNSGLDGFSVVNARIGFEAEKGWSAYLFANNLFDKVYAFNHYTSSDLSIIGQSQIAEDYGPPRTYGVRLGYRF